ncbi:PilX N-terminal domain-containing pilus assembly protein [Herbaspirillum sp. YR522]|uniref:PilX N-terminal domain-containing pilus assembly protein n=1 Tax=Herbaspirillum sp. YR522 TaxID=1144342 RepID=UPI00026F7F0A|nr:PilX N-terminal domain-containing pilus assembly protein [Herbaspirillum sp. YR522]EJN10043.1 hypothetical protein PMI40_00306 [Herbaspirillum sp. YR522]
MKSTSRQRGATLIITLTLVIVILLLGASSARLRMLEEHAARNHQGLDQARLAAQAALDDALVDLGGARWENDQRLPEPRTANLGDSSGMTAAFDADRLPMPGYTIEWIRTREWRRRALYRVTARGFGAGQARATLQMLVRRLEPERGVVTLEVLGWRRGRWPDGR